MNMRGLAAVIACCGMSVCETARAQDLSAVEQRWIELIESFDDEWAAEQLETWQRRCEAVLASSPNDRWQERLTAYLDLAEDDRVEIRRTRRHLDGLIADFSERRVEFGTVVAEIERASNWGAIHDPIGLARRQYELAVAAVGSPHRGQIEKLLSRAAATFDHEELVVPLVSIELCRATSRLLEQQPEAAERHASRALALCDRLGTDAPTRPTANFALGDARSRLGRVDAAIVAWREALVGFRDRDATPATLMFRASIAERLVAVGRRNEAIQIVERLLADPARDRDPRTGTRLAVVLDRVLGRGWSSREQVEQIRERAARGEQPLVEAWANLKLAEMSRRAGEIEAAFDALDATDRICRVNGWRDMPRRVALERARCFAWQRDVPRARETLAPLLESPTGSVVRAAAHALRGDLAEDEQVAVPDRRQAARLFARSGDANGEIAQRVRLARSAVQRGDMESATKNVLRALDKLSAARRRHSSWEEAVAILADDLDVFDDVIDGLLSRGTPAGIELAFSISERLKGGALRDELLALERRGRGERRTAHVLATLAAREHSLTRQLSELAMESPERARAQDALARVRSRGVELRRSLARPDLEDLAAEAYDLPRACAAMSEGDLLLAFHSTRRATWLWVIQPTGARIEELAGRTELVPRVREFVSLVSARPGHDSHVAVWASGRALARELLEPIQAELGGARRLFLVGDRELVEIPFCALVTAPETLPSSWDELRYLGVEHGLEIFSGRSVSLLCDAKTGDGATTVPTWTACAASSRDSGDLRWVDQEVDGIRALAEANGRKFEALSTDVPSGTPELLHFAGHASLRDRGAVLDLGHGREVAAADVATIGYSAQFVNLAGCWTGHAPFTGGEGGRGLVNAFLANGARGVLATRWRVVDEAAFRFNSTLYNAIAAGESIGSALLVARRDLRAHSRFSAPFHWAAANYVGSPVSFARRDR